MEVRTGEILEAAKSLGRLQCANINVPGDGAIPPLQANSMAVDRLAFADFPAGAPPVRPKE